MSFIMGLKLERVPFFAAIFDVDVAVMFLFFDFAFQLFQCLGDRSRFFDIVDVLGFPIFAAISDDFSGVD